LELKGIEVEEDVEKERNLYKPSFPRMLFNSTCLETCDLT
jgi:hypothetical protein